MNIQDSKKIFCDQLNDDFDLSRAEAVRNGVIVKAVEYGKNARKYLSGSPFLYMAMLDGKLTVVADQAILPFMRNYIAAQAEPFRAFDAPSVFMLDEELHRHGHAVGNMLQGFLLGDDAARAANDDNVRFYHGQEIEQLYSYKNLHHAFCYTTTEKRRDVLAAAIFDGGRLAAVAACSNDGERMWQIGVDVLAEHRNKGLGTRVVRALAAETEKQGYCPYYCCAWSNVASMRTARAAGFVPCWVELASSPIADDFMRGEREKVFGKGRADE